MLPFTSMSMSSEAVSQTFFVEPISEGSSRTIWRNSKPAPELASLPSSRRLRRPVTSGNWACNALRTSFV